MCVIDHMVPMWRIGALYFFFLILGCVFEPWVICVYSCFRMIDNLNASNNKCARVPLDDFLFLLFDRFCPCFRSVAKIEPVETVET